MTTLQTAGAAMDSADQLKELIAQQAVEIERLQTAVKHLSGAAAKATFAEKIALATAADMTP